MSRLIRPMTLADCERVGTIHTIGWQAGYRGILPDVFLDGLSVQDRIERRRHAFLNPRPGTSNWVLELDGGVDGFAITGPSRDIHPPGAGELYAIYLDPVRWGGGHGTALLGPVLAGLASQGFGEVTLWVLSGNSRGRRFYERNRFETDGAEKWDEFGGALLSEVRYRRRV